MTGDLKYINKSLEKSFKILEILSKSIFPQKAATISLVIWRWAKVIQVVFTIGIHS